MSISDASGVRLFELRTLVGKPFEVLKTQYNGEAQLQVAEVEGICSLSYILARPIFCAGTSCAKTLQHEGWLPVSEFGDGIRHELLSGQLSVRWWVGRSGRSKRKG